MKKRIYITFFVIIFLCSLLIATSVSIIVNNTITNQQLGAIKDTAVSIADVLNKGIEAGEYDFADYVNFGADTARITIIAPDGTVLIDSKASAANMDNHADREEVIQARQTGSGEITRYSDTLRTDTYNYAVLLSDGNVLRVSQTISSITEVFFDVIPSIAVITLIAMLVSFLLAGRITRSIIRPLDEIDFDGDNTAIYDELVPFIRKIEKQKQEIDVQIDALKNRAKTIEDITGNMREGLILLDSHGIVLSANRSVSEIFGDAVGKSILTACRDLDFRESVKKCLSGENTEILYEHDDKIYSVYFSPAKGNGGGAVILFFDITARHESEKQRREFSANVSHELKTPLTSISALSEMIANGMAKKDDVKSFAEKISEQTKRLIDIIEDIIRLSEFDEGGLREEFTAFDLLNLAEKAAESLREKAGDIEITVTGEHFNVLANKRMMDELFYNLIDNSVKYNTENGKVTVAISRDDGMYIIDVTDTGIGIPKVHQSRIFERFYRVDKSRNKKTGGTGLGLSIVKHITEYHGGNVSLISAVGKGTAIICKIPMNIKN